jgi:hypothetical protein
VAETAFAVDDTAIVNVALCPLVTVTEAGHEAVTLLVRGAMLQFKFTVPLKPFCPVMAPV